ncbi:MAG: VOC family protein [Actinobacteria bacterium]|nr:VOC family protein [Actinomycetota bacterium]
MDVERVDFITVPTRDYERARAFYRDTLGLPPDARNGAELATPNVTIAFWNPELEDGETFTPNTAGFALRVPDVAAARARLEEAGVDFLGETVDTGVCHMAFFSDPDGNTIILHRRYAPCEQG